MFLTPEELRELTDKRVRPAQVRVLRAMGIEHRVRPDGSVVVLRSHVEKLLGGDTKQSKKAPDIEPDWGALNK